MFRKGQARTPRSGNDPLLDFPACEWNECDPDWRADFEPGPTCRDFWDAFERDDETAEPEPEPGDFWGEVDDESPI